MAAALVFVLAACAAQDGEQPVGAYRSDAGFAARVSKLAEASVQALAQRAAARIGQGEVASTVSSIRASIAWPDPTPPAYEGDYTRVASVTEPFPRVFQVDLIVYQVASIRDGLGFAVGRGTPRWGRACGTSTIDVSSGAASAQATTTIVDCPAGTPERPTLRNDR